jgi:hypothetical protein
MMIPFKEFYKAAIESGWLEEGKNSMARQTGGVLRGGFVHKGFYYTNGAGWCSKEKLTEKDLEAKK